MGNEPGGEIWKLAEQCLEPIHSPAQKLMRALHGPLTRCFVQRDRPMKGGAPACWRQLLIKQSAFLQPIARLPVCLAPRTANPLNC